MISQVIARFDIRFGSTAMWINLLDYLRVNASPQKMQEYGLTPESGVLVSADLTELLTETEPDLRRSWCLFRWSVLEKDLLHWPQRTFFVAMVGLSEFILDMECPVQYRRSTCKREMAVLLDVERHEIIIAIENCLEEGLKPPNVAMQLSPQSGHSTLLVTSGPFAELTRARPHSVACGACNPSLGKFGQVTFDSARQLQETSLKRKYKLLSTPERWTRWER
jgi:hypothetical protein